MSKLSLEAPSTNELTAAKPTSEIQITYRPITCDDVVQMSQLHAAAYRDAGSSAASQLKLFWDGAYGSLLDSATLGAWHEDKLVGVVIVLDQAPDEWCTTDGNSDQPYIADLFVDPDYRRQGIGSGLVINASRAVDALGREALTLQLDMSAAPEAMQLYDALGFSTR